MENLQESINYLTEYFERRVDATTKEDWDAQQHFYELRQQTENQSGFIALAKHIIAMKDDTYLSGHPEFVAIVEEAEKLIKP